MRLAVELLLDTLEELHDALEVFVTREGIVSLPLPEAEQRRVTLTRRPEPGGAQASLKSLRLAPSQAAVTVVWGGGVACSSAIARASFPQHGQTRCPVMMRL